ncbi:TetR/AcrR family transcriptional regulator [Psychromicrobium lacuslunae]|uniref:HTH tetR-type domain-containing protein n=1 Tax=Psychromicrobium lacuslunae TaxID=1618207 RepID=A0A0D4BXL6_9MICC|nr:TetR/AcrR family transcriptional regulator [Psychromicrobium lacuslunae]AJT40866.1 hypothetical protein UM93_03900 [Psychromicrobium lacuslunae]
MTDAAERSYHHGDLRRALLDGASDLIERGGVSDLSLRELARQLDVSHAAPKHHFGDKRGLLTALAAEGYQLLADSLEETAQLTKSFREVGVSYVAFAVNHRAHFEVMFSEDLFDPAEPALQEARARADRALKDNISRLGDGSPLGDQRTNALAAWSLVHGYASLWLSGNLDGDPLTGARAVTGVLFGRDQEESTNRGQ